MIGRERNLHTITDNNLTIHNGWRRCDCADSQNSGFRRIDDGGEALDIEHAEIAHREGTSAQLFWSQLASAGCFGKALCFSCNLQDTTLVRMTHNGNDQTLFEGDGDAD